jgi:hypothetical protein
MDGHAGATIDDVRPLDEGDPRVVGGCPLLGRIGSGGMGTVYLAHMPGDDTTRVAVKTVHPHLAADAAYRERFRDEAMLASRVASFCTARVLAHGEEDGRPYIVSEYVGGVSLRHRIASGGPLPGAEAHGVAVGTASALAAIHAAGLVHRDLKPANVMLTLSGCRVIDFGIARFAGAEVADGDRDGHGRSGSVLGTPGWVAPELLRGGQVTPASDIFSWGCLIAFACTGRMPFGQDGPMAVLRRALREEPDLDGLPPPLLPAVRSALAPRPQDRPSASGLLLSLVEQVAPTPSDTPGAIDAPGVAGTPGAVGAPGAAGASAPAGTSGTEDAPGAASVPGAVSASGAVGASGAVDAPGAVGVPGTVGVPGAVGGPALVGAPAAVARSRGWDDGNGPDTAAFGVLGQLQARSSRRVRLVAGAATAVVVIMVGGLAMGLTGGRDREGAPTSQISVPPPPASSTVPSAPPEPRPKERPGRGGGSDEKDQKHGEPKKEGKPGKGNKGKGKGKHGRGD